VETELAQGPVEQTFTFTTPDVGTYSFNCIAHPDQMTGTLTIEEGAEIPEASQP
jgi:plastocyanin